MMDQRHRHSVEAFIRGLAKVLVHVSEIDSSAMPMRLFLVAGAKRRLGRGVNKRL